MLFYVVVVGKRMPLKRADKRLGQDEKIQIIYLRI